MKKFSWKTEKMIYNDNPPGVNATFHLKYGSLLIGFLIYDKDKWIFKYSDEFKNQNVLKPITDFPDLNKVYESKELWPFFAIRIPAINQPYQLKKIKKANIDKNDAIGLLKVFGMKSINNPFKLIPQI